MRVRTRLSSLPRDVWLLEAGAAVNSFGSGAAYPFLLIYLHNVRGYGLALTGALVGATTALGFATGLVAGSLVDRIGARRTLLASLLVLTGGWVWLPHATGLEWTAVALTAIAFGGSAFWPATSAMLAGLTNESNRHLGYALEGMGMNLGFGLGSLAGGVIASTADPGTFTTLFTIDAATFLGFALVVPFLREPHREPVAKDDRGRYAEVLRDRTFFRLLALRVSLIIAGYVGFELLPVFAVNQAGVSERAIGVIFFVNTVANVTLQLPVARLLEGRRRMPAMAVGAALWATFLLVILAGGVAWHGSVAAVVFAAAGVLFALGECIEGVTFMPLVADMAPERLLGRYMALPSVCWDVSEVAGPAVGGVILASAPLLLWPAWTVLAVISGVGFLRLESALPVELRVIAPSEPEQPEPAAAPTVVAL